MPRAYSLDPDWGDKFKYMENCFSPVGKAYGFVVNVAFGYRLPYLCVLTPNRIYPEIMLVAHLTDPGWLVATMDDDLDPLHVEQVDGIPEKVSRLLLLVIPSSMVPIDGDPG